jgi:hypothetical protein
MKQILKFGVVLYATAVAWAQLPESPKTTQAIIQVKYADVNRLSGVLAPIFGGNVRADPNLHVITISGSPDTVAAFTKAVKELDVRPQEQPNVELTVYLISGVAQGQPGDQIPPELDSTVKQLRSLFAYKAYRLADTVVLRGRAVAPGDRVSQQQADGVLPGTNMRYSFTYLSLNVSPETPRMVHLNTLNFTLRRARTTQSKDGPAVTEYSDTTARISTDLDLREGQKTVVGKSSINNEGDAMILVIVPRITD